MQSNHREESVSHRSLSGQIKTNMPEFAGGCNGPVVAQGRGKVLSTSALPSIPSQLRYKIRIQIDLSSKDLRKPDNENEDV